MTDETPGARPFTRPAPRKQQRGRGDRFQRAWVVLRAVAVLGAALFLYGAARQVLAWIGSQREPIATACYGREEAQLRIVYLHGIDTRGPGWIEAQNRRKLHALAERLDARIALPRAPAGWWEHSTDEAMDRSLAVARKGAETCFGGRDEFGVIAFSYGAAFANEVFVRCRRDDAFRWIVSAGGVGLVPRAAGSLERCGRIRVVAGRHEPVFAESSSFALQLRAHGADAAFVAHGGPHEIPFVETLASIEELEGIDGR